MARTRADDWGDKRALIYDRAAELFAAQGFSRTSIAALAAHCGASKSWIYHYFPSKEAILHAILQDHMTLLLRTAEGEVEKHAAPEAQLRGLLRAFMAIYGATPEALGFVPPDDTGRIAQIRSDEFALVHADDGLVALLESQTQGLRMVLSGMFDVYPNLKVILGHFGEGLPFLLWRVDSALSRPGNKSGSFRKVFSDHFYITTSGVNWVPTLKFGIEVLGADRVMWAIDYPYQETMEATKWLNDAPISPEDKAKVFGKNAERVFRIKSA